MNERVVPGPVQDSCGIREAVCIHTKKIYDSCRDKDCIEDLRVYPTRASQAVIDRALSVRGGRAELLQAYIDVEPASYNRGFYSVDIRYYYRITAEAFDGGCRRLYVTLGQFSMVRLERDSQLLIPMYDYCMPTRECAGGDEEGDEDPCEIFRQIRFPVGEFFPPSTLPGMTEEEAPAASSSCCR